MATKSRTSYGSGSGSSRRGAPAPSPRPERPAATSIDLNALKGQDGLRAGDRVRIRGGGLYTGEMAVVVRLSGTAIPTAIVRTDAGNQRTVRTIDLDRMPGGAEPKAPAADEEPAD